MGFIRTNRFNSNRKFRYNYHFNSWNWFNINNVEYNIIKYIILILLLVSCSNNENMNLFQSMLPVEEKQTNPFPIEDDGYLYVYAMGQSNMVGSYPDNSDEFYAGDKTNPSNVYIPDLLGSWKLAKFNTSPFSSYGNNLALTFCRELADKHNLQIRMIFNSAGAKFIHQWHYGETMWIRLEEILNTFRVGGEFTNEYRPSSLWLQHQGENDDNDSYATYFSKWDIVRQQLLDNGYIKSNHNFICGELARIRIFNNILRQISNDNINYKIAHSDGMEKGDIVHFLGTALVTMGERYMARYEELIFGILPPNDLIVPGNPNPIVSNLTSIGCTLTWIEPSINSGLTITKYKIYNQNGYIFYGEVDNSTFSLNVIFSKIGGETEGWNVLAEDSAGNTTMWRAEGNQLNILIP